MSNSETYKIKMIIGKDTLTATLIDNPTTKDFISLLPLDLKLDDYAGTEKVSYLKKNYLQKMHLLVLILQLEI